MKNSALKIQSVRSGQALFTFLIFTLAFALNINAQIATGGQFTLDQSVIATGGGTSSGGTLRITGTSGQSVAGTTSTAPGTTLKSGFWTPQPLGPSAAAATTGGRVTTASGLGVKNVVITLAQSDGTIRIARTVAFGYYRFDEVASGQTVVVTAASKRFQFAIPTQVLTLTGDADNIDFVALDQN